jgi:hypothetical protein
MALSIIFHGWLLDIRMMVTSDVGSGPINYTSLALLLLTRAIS